MAVLVGMVDVVMVAAVGESAVSGVSLVDSISVLIIQIMGSPGYRRRRYIGPVPGQGAAQGCQKGSRAAGPGYLASLSHHCRDSSCRGRHLLGGIFGKVEQDVMDNAQTYFWITALSYPFIGLYNACAALFPFHGQLKGIHDDFLCHEYD